MRLSAALACSSSASIHSTAARGVDCGRVVDWNDVRADVDCKHQLGAAEDHGLDPLLGELGDQGLELALAVADDPAGGELLEDDPVDLARSTARRSARSVIPRPSMRGCG